MSGAIIFLEGSQQWPFGVIATICPLNYALNGTRNVPGKIPIGP